MVLKPEQERVKTLLRDTITLLCKNGLEFRDKFSVDAVIGVTVDDSDVFLVSMNEIIKSEKSLLQEAVSSMAEEESKNEGREDETELGQRRRRRKRKRHRIKTENGEEEEVSASSDGENSMDNGMDQPEQKRFSSSVEQGGVSKQEPTSGAEEIIDDEDIVVIKEEIDTWGADQFSSGQQGSEGGNPAFFGVHGQQDNEDYGEMSLSGMQDGSWPSSSSHSMSQQGQYHMSSGMSRSATVTSGGGDMTQGQGPQQTRPVGVSNFICRFCDKQLLSKHSLIIHEELHEGKYRHHCDVCKRGFSSLTHLRGHMASHTGKREFVCPICLKSFIYSNHLRRHERNIHKVFSKRSSIRNKNLQMMTFNQYN